MNQISDHAADPNEADVWSVSRLTQSIRQRLTTIPPVWVDGEISNFSRAGSGHCYLTLKDAHSQIRAVIWRDQAQRLAFEPQDGLRVLAHGVVDVYGARGQYQLKVLQLVPKGVGPLELAFRQLRDKLAAEGLFAPERKKTLPTIPYRVALITSPKGAAIRDFLEVAQRRWRWGELIVLPVAVQGQNAAGQIVSALAKVEKLQPDVVALVRGGGSLEDLWAFNEEPLVRAVAACSVPTVSGVGHEVDLTITDLVADLRALTPTEAAERIFPDRLQTAERLRNYRERLASNVQTQLEMFARRVTVAAQSRALADPGQLFEERARLLDDSEAALNRATLQRLETLGEAVAQRARALDALSPLKVLERGYSLTMTQEDRLIACAAQLTNGQDVRIRFHDGNARARITEVDAT